MLFFLQRLPYELDAAAGGENLADEVGKVDDDEEKADQLEPAESKQMQ